jgi:hypothetical protein
MAWPLRAAARRLPEIQTLMPMISASPKSWQVNHCITARDGELPVAFLALEGMRVLLCVRAAAHWGRLLSQTDAICAAESDLTARLSLSSFRTVS